jgi:hypothetical protein
MCPVCIATAAWIAASAVSTGGLTAFVLKKMVTGKTVHNIPVTSPSKEDHNG